MTEKQIKNRCETFVADVEGIGTFGDLFDGPTELDREETTGKEEALED